MSDLVCLYSKFGMRVPLGELQWNVFGYGYNVIHIKKKTDVISKCYLLKQLFDMNE